jgi:hypothetical protein
MGTMSASNAAPLPRLGEVFFDVRSAARSLRISWYADTGVAVLSIWQGETCTGSFRLPMADLPRMIEALQRGPDVLAGPGGEDQAPSGQSAQAGQPGPAAAAGGREPANPGSLHYLAAAPPGAHPDQATAWYPGDAATAGYPADAAAGGYPDSPAGYRDEQAAAHHPDGLTAPGRQERLAPARHATQPGQPPDAGQPPHADPSPYPGEPGVAQYPGQPGEPLYPGVPGLAYYPEQPGESPYPGEPGQAYYRQQPSGPGGAHQLVWPPAPAGPGRPNSVPESAGRHPSGGVTRDYSPPLPGIENRSADVPPPAGPRWPRRSDEQPEDHWDTGSSGPAGDGLEPLPESFPYSLRLPDHELR